mmetsp:Transcript_17399/g.26582  ORF Transcript_17399/g.26582 Transcript_17399/m.26582 type:complete len:140 (-) Transcript_17399:764-1183(-)
MWMLANGFAHCGNTTRGGNRNYIVVVPEARIDRAQLAILAFKDNHNRVLISVAGGISVVLAFMIQHSQDANVAILWLAFHCIHNSMDANTEQVDWERSFFWTRSDKASNRFSKSVLSALSTTSASGWFLRKRSDQLSSR